MKTIFKILIAVSVLAIIFNNRNFKSDSRYKIGILAPMQHSAIDKIIEGVQGQIETEGDSNIVITVQNSMGDQVLSRACLGKFISQKYDVIICIGTELTQLALQMTQAIPIIGLDISKGLLGSSNRLLGVIEPLDNPTFDFLKALKRSVNKISFIFSMNHKNYEYFKFLETISINKNFILEPIIVETLSDLYSLDTRISPDSDFILISKDHLAASGASAIAKTAEKLKIPFISSDEGSVCAGAAAAITNSEYQVGAIGGEIAMKLYNGKQAKELNHVYIDKFEIYVNKYQALKQNLNFEALEAASRKMAFATEIKEREF